MNDYTTQNGFDNGLAPKRMPQKRSKVMGKAHERIVTTERSLERSQGETRAARQSARAYEDILNNLVHEGFREQFTRDMGRMLGEAAAKHLKEKATTDIPEITQMFLPESLERLSRETGNNMAGMLADMLMSNMRQSYDMARDVQHMETRVYASIQFRSFEITAAQIIPRHAIETMIRR